MRLVGWMFDDRREVAGKFGRRFGRRFVEAAAVGVAIVGFMALSVGEADACRVFGFLLRVDMFRLGVRRRLSPIGVRFDLRQGTTCHGADKSERADTHGTTQVRGQKLEQRFGANVRNATEGVPYRIRIPF